MPEVQRGDREGRDPAVPRTGSGEQALRLGDLPALGLEHGQCTQGREIGLALGGVSAQHVGLGVTPNGLEDSRPLRIECVPVRAVSSRGVEVGECLGEPVEGASRPGPGQQGRAVVGHVADELLGQLGGTFVVGHPAQHMPAQQKQVGQEGSIGDRRASIA